jgi:hypothetical protein
MAELAPFCTQYAVARHQDQSVGHCLPLENLHYPRFRKGQLWSVFDHNCFDTLIRRDQPFQQTLRRPGPRRSMFVFKTPKASK